MGKHISWVGGVGWMARGWVSQIQRLLLVWCTLVAIWGKVLDLDERIFRGANTPGVRCGSTRKALPVIRRNLGGLPWTVGVHLPIFKWHGCGRGSPTGCGDGCGLGVAGPSLCLVVVFMDRRPRTLGGKWSGLDLGWVVRHTLGASLRDGGGSIQKTRQDSTGFLDGGCPGGSRVSRTL